VSKWAAGWQAGDALPLNRQKRREAQRRRRLRRRRLLAVLVGFAILLAPVPYSYTTKIVPNGMQPSTRYLVPDDRDFFAVYRRLPGPVIVPLG